MRIFVYSVAIGNSLTFSSKHSMRGFRVNRWE